ncbi:hypothetical protein D3C72_2464350 [compost metagenome]
MLTAIAMSSGQFMASMQAVRMTHAPMGTISPVSSMRGMKVSGGMRPRSGWFQRSRASQLETFPVSRFTSGW